jgi:hypothetical protein
VRGRKPKFAHAAHHASCANSAFKWAREGSGLRVSFDSEGGKILAWADTETWERMADSPSGPHCFAYFSGSKKLVFVTRY